MARLLVKTPQIDVTEIHLTPGRNLLGREGENDFLVPHPSVSRHHCEVWLTEESVLVRDLESRNGTWVEDQRVHEAEVLAGQTLRLGDVELVLAEAPARISVPDLPLPAQRRAQTFMPDGAPSCYHHDAIEAKLECAKCHHFFCTECVRELKVAGGVPRRFCPDCGGPCERIAATVKQEKRAGWLNKIVDAFTKPTLRK
jgi:hypothetical protein